MIAVLEMPCGKMDQLVWYGIISFKGFIFPYSVEVVLTLSK